MANFVGVRCGRAWAATWLACVVTGCGSNGDAEPDASSSDTGANADSSASGDESGEACVADCKPGGTVLWETHVGGPGEDGAFALAFDAEGRFQREARALAALSHPRICSLFERTRCNVFVSPPSCGGLSAPSGASSAGLIPVPVRSLAVIMIWS